MKSNKTPAPGSAGSGEKFEARLAKLKETGEAKQKAGREKKRQELLEDRQLTLWVDTVRGVPNEALRSALFTARNRKQPRENLKSANIAVIGDGEIIYTGEELRQDDETVWLQLIHLARENGLATPFTFTPHSFCQAINWPVSGQSYDRLDKCMTRLQATSLKVKSDRLGEQVALSMLPGYKCARRKDGDGGLWTVRMHDELVFLFSEKIYTRLEWERRLSLPEGFATWLHAYYASHRVPYAVKVETLAHGAGLLGFDEKEEHEEIDEAARESKRKERLRDIKKLVKKGLETLLEAGFLTEFYITPSGLVHVRRVGDTRPIE